MHKLQHAWLPKQPHLTMQHSFTQLTFYDQQHTNTTKMGTKSKHIWPSPASNRGWPQHALPGVYLCGTHSHTRLEKCSREHAITVLVMPVCLDQPHVPNTDHAHSVITATSSTFLPLALTLFVVPAQTTYRHKSEITDRGVGTGCPTVWGYTVHWPNQVTYNIPSCGPCWCAQSSLCIASLCKK